MTWPELLNAERRRTSSVTGDYREEFERDFDRAIFSTPVKRLQDKAQVFPLEPHDAVRTRLTHSLEVSSVARGLATRVSRWMESEGCIEQGMDRKIESIARCCGLIHDLGNPPFGHAGEEAIQSWFKTRFNKPELSGMIGSNSQLADDFLKFEGNAQTLRLVAKLQILADEYGLNLTYGTLSASCKYIAAAHEAGQDGNQALKKPGYFASESRLVAEIRQRTGTGVARNPIAYVVEAADDIVYAVADVEDGIKKGVLSWRELTEELQNPELRISEDLISQVMIRKNKILGTDGREPTEKFQDDIHASAFRTASIGVLVEAADDGFKSHYNAIMEGSHKTDLFEGSDALPLLEGLKTIGRKRIYCTDSTLKLELLGRRIISDLMDLFWEGAEKLPLEGLPSPRTFPGKLGRLLSENYRRVFQIAVEDPDLGLPVNYHRFQLVTDYVCGMTDSFAKRLHAELTNG
jgi:dGTPase